MSLEPPKGAGVWGLKTFVSLCSFTFVQPEKKRRKTIFFKTAPYLSPALGARNETRNQTDPSPAPSALEGWEEVQTNRPLQCNETSHAQAMLSEIILFIGLFTCLLSCFTQELKVHRACPKSCSDLSEALGLGQY